MRSDPKAMVQKLWDFCDTEILVGGRGQEMVAVL